MIRKVFRTGHGIGVSLPKEIAYSLNITEGVKVLVELDGKNQRIIIRPIDGLAAIDIDVDFARQVTQFIQEYRPALEALVRK